jgi:urocanate hydratase
MHLQTPHTGATWVAIHNGGGCGWGEVVNGGFGLFLDGSAEVSSITSHVCFCQSLVQSRMSLRAIITCLASATKH